MRFAWKLINNPLCISRLAWHLPRRRVLDTEWCIHGSYGRPRLAKARDGSCLAPPMTAARPHVMVQPWQWSPSLLWWCGRGSVTRPLAPGQPWQWQSSSWLRERAMATARKQVVYGPHDKHCVVILVCFHLAAVGWHMNGDVNWMSLYRKCFNQILLSLAGWWVDNYLVSMCVTHDHLQGVLKVWYVGNQIEDHHFLVRVQTC